MELEVNVVALSGGRILLVRKNQEWILPLVKPKKGESDIDCIKKKIKEELPEVESEIVRLYKVFSKTSSCGGLENRVYLTEIRVNINKISNEIEEARWFYYIQTLTYELSDITKKIIEDMKRKGYL